MEINDVQKRKNNLVCFFDPAFVVSIGAMKLAEAQTDKIKEGKDKLDKEIKKLEKSKKQSDIDKKQYFKTAYKLLEKIENGADTTKEFEALTKYIEKNGKSIKARQVEYNPNKSLSVGQSSVTQVTFGIEDTPIHQISTKAYATNHSRNDCQDTSQGSQSGSLTDQGNDQLLVLYNSYPTSISSGFFPNCSNHTWNNGVVQFVDIFGLLECTSTVDDASGWHSGVCDDWGSVGPLTIAQVNALYSQGHAYQILPAVGFVV